MPRRTPVIDTKPIIPDPPPAVTPPASPKAIASDWRTCAVCGNSAPPGPCPVDGDRGEA